MWSQLLKYVDRRGRVCREGASSWVFVCVWSQLTNSEPVVEMCAPTWWRFREGACVCGFVGVRV